MSENIMFEELGYDKRIIDGLKKESIINPTKVQEVTTKKILENKNLVVQSETGSGKTLAYLLPMFEKLKQEPKGMSVLVLVPTHELAMQVHKQVSTLSLNSGIKIKSTPILGNVNIKRQIEQLREKPQIVIGTTGRILELIKKKKITAHTIKTVVIDEADKLLDTNNIDGTKAVIKCCMRDTQVIMFSASIPENMEKQISEVGKDPEFVKTNETISIPENIEHVYIVTERRDKLVMLRKLISALEPEKAMIFINKFEDIDEATEKLRYHHYDVECISGSNIKSDRKRAIEEFRNGKLKYLIATDIAARGLHFDNVDVVVHITIPEESLDYLHRSGRCGRGENKGLSVSIVTQNEINRIHRFEKVFGIKMTEKTLYKGKFLDV
ncbi:MAG: DEAD/DEAH box helicase [Oscillospiraceae bacterium]